MELLKFLRIHLKLEKLLKKFNAEAIEGEELKISFSAKFVMDALKALEGTDIKISFTGAMSPFVIRPLYDDQMLQLILTC